MGAACWKAKGCDGAWTGFDGPERICGYRCGVGRRRETAGDLAPWSCLWSRAKKIAGCHGSLSGSVNGSRVGTESRAVTIAYPPDSATGNAPRVAEIEILGDAGNVAEAGHGCRC